MVEFEILNSFTSLKDWCAFLLIAFVMAIAVGILCFFDRNINVKVRVACTIIVVLSACGIYWTTSIVPKDRYYEVVMDENISMSDLLKNYEVVGTRGRIAKIKEIGK